MSLFEFLNINETVAHEVFKRGIDKELVTPNMGKDLITFDAPSTSTLQERIVNAMTNDTHCIEMSIINSSSGSTVDCVNTLISCDLTEFAELSETLAHNLSNAQQTRRIPGGALIVIRGVTGSERKSFLAVIKAEMQEGFIKDSSNGSITIKHLSDLLLTPQQRLYKMGLFIKNSEEAGDYRIFVYDQTMTANETKSAATYFYSVFLGCSFSPTDKKLTSDFYNHTLDFLNKLDVDEEKRLDLKTSLYTYLKVSNSTTIKTSDFANQYLEKKHKPLYESHMDEKSFPKQAVNKDLTFLKNKLRRRKLKFNSDVKIDAPQENFSDLIVIDKFHNGFTELKVKGSICGNE